MFELKKTDVLEIGCTPHEEDCAQVGSPDYRARARAECNAYRNQLIRLFGKPPEGAELIIKSNPHDFGTYYEVAVRFEEDNEKATDYAFDMENNSPAHWDEEAKAELAQGSPVIDHEEKIPVVGVPLTLDSIAYVSCPHCGTDRSVEPDANYVVTCEGCSKKYKCRSEI